MSAYVIHLTGSYSGYACNRRGDGDLINDRNSFFRVLFRNTYRICCQGHLGADKHRCSILSLRVCVKLGRLPDLVVDAERQISGISFCGSDHSL